MSVDGGVSEFGQYSVITINRGARDGVEVGHVLAALPARRADRLDLRAATMDFFTGHLTDAAS